MVAGAQSRTHARSAHGSASSGASHRSAGGGRSSMVRTKASWNGTNGDIVQPPAPGARCVALWNVYDETAASIARWCAQSSAATAPRNSWPNVLSSCMPSSRADAGRRARRRASRR